MRLALARGFLLDVALPAALPVTFFAALVFPGRAHPVLTPCSLAVPTAINAESAKSDTKLVRRATLQPYKIRHEMRKLLRTELRELGVARANVGKLENARPKQLSPILGHGGEG